MKKIHRRQLCRGRAIRPWVKHSTSHKFKPLLEFLILHLILLVSNKHKQSKNKQIHRDKVQDREVALCFLLLNSIHSNKSMSQQQMFLLRQVNSNLEKKHIIPASYVHQQKVEISLHTSQRAADIRKTNNSACEGATLFSTSRLYICLCVSNTAVYRKAKP